jgi:hypothetical protein
VSPAIQQALREAGVSVVTYASASGRFPLTPDPVVISDLQGVRGNPLLLAWFGTAVVLTALVTTAELALLFGFHVSKVETCLQRQIDAFTDFLRQGQFKTVQWMSVEGRIASLQAALVREHLKALGEKELVAVRGRYLARKVPMEEGPVRASQSPFDEALNEGHRQIGWILRAENATAGLGYFTSGMLFFHQRVSGKSVHLDLDETARRVIDNQVLALFLAGNLTIKDFNRDIDAFGFPAYRAKATCVETIHRAVDEVLQRPLRTAGQQRTLLDAHRSSLGSLLSAARDHDIGKFSPLIYLPSDRLPRLLSTLAPLRNLAQHLRSRIDSADPSSASALIVTQALEMCEMMML